MPASGWRLEGDELQAVRKHVELGADIISDSGINNDVRAMVLHHHERHDGSGYPHPLAGDHIPVFARIAAIVDAFDAMTSHRSYARAMSPSAAISILHAARDVEFRSEIVEEFIQAIGLYPAGTLVELTSGEVGVIVSEYRTHRLHPKLMLLLDGYKKPLPKARALEEALYADSDLTPVRLCIRYRLFLVLLFQGYSRERAKSRLLLRHARSGVRAGQKSR
ncbi:MAG: hypothetical protein ACI87W_003279 [Halieaceae bacterium]|jgi:hypothetical protein